MKNILLLLLFAVCRYTYGQKIVFDQPYYYMIDGSILLFNQKNDTLSIYKCDGFKDCNELSLFTYLLKKDSIVDSTLTILFVDMIRANNREIKTKTKQLFSYKKENGRMIFSEFSKLKSAGLNGLPTLYPTSEIEKLTPYEKMEKGDAKRIRQEILAFLATIPPEKMDVNYFIIWRKYIDLLIKNGYNPIGTVLPEK